MTSDPNRDEEQPFEEEEEFILADLEEISGIGGEEEELVLEEEPSQPADIVDVPVSGQFDSIVYDEQDTLLDPPQTVEDPVQAGLGDEGDLVEAPLSAVFDFLGQEPVEGVPAEENAEDDVELVLEDADLLADSPLADSPALAAAGTEAEAAGVLEDDSWSLPGGGDPEGEAAPGEAYSEERTETYEEAYEETYEEAYEDEPELGEAWDEAAPADESYDSQLQGGVARRGSWRLVAGIAAVLLVGAGATFAVVHPEWLRSHLRSTVVERTSIARPHVDLALAPPIRHFPPVTHEPPKLPPVAVEPPPVKDPPVVAPPLGPAHPVTPAHPPLVAVDPGGEPKQGIEVPDLDVLAVGDEVKIGRYVGSGQTSGGFENAKANGVVSGSQAFAQLTNDNFFIGTVKAIDALALTIEIEKGEVTLPFVDVRFVTSITSEEYQQLLRASRGFVKLTNRNRIVGKLLHSDDGTITVFTDDKRVTIPRSEIEEIGDSGIRRIKVADDSKDEWFKKQVEKRLKNRR